MGVAQYLGHRQVVDDVDLLGESTLLGEFFYFPQERRVLDRLGNVQGGIGQREIVAFVYILCLLYDGQLGPFRERM